MMKTALLLSAGRGDRLRPLTDALPKALYPIKGKPLIEHHLIRLAQSGFENVVINHAYLGGQIRHYLGNGQRFGIKIIYSPEPPGGLETGGGIVNALPLLGNDPFVTINSDVYTDFDLNILSLSQAPLQLVLIKNNLQLGHKGDFGLEEKIVLNTNKEYTFSGIACYHPAVFSQCQQGRYSVTPLLRQIVEQKKALGIVHQGYWFDIGSLARIKACQEDHPL